MRFLNILVIVLIVLGITIETHADWSADLDELIKTESNQTQDELIQKIVKSDPNWQEVVAHIKSIKFADNVETGKVFLDSTLCIDGVMRPWVLYVPSNYNPKQAAPLLVLLHGGVGRAEILDDPLAYVEENSFQSLAEKLGGLAIYPFGQAGALWWDEVGMTNINNLVRTVKRNYNVDDDRVFMGGFSDGASASFCYAMINPTDYAAFMALNGHIGVGSLDGDLATYAPNIFNTPVYTITTDRDQLYPAHKMRATIDMARRAGGNIFYRELEGEHDFAYAEEELPRIARFLERHPRDPLPTEIVWETAERQFGLCRWFAIDEITIDEAAPWHVDHTAMLVDDRITIGFMSVDYEGSGVKVGKVIEDSFAEKTGLQTEDVIIKGGKKAIENIDDLNDFKAGFKRGDPVELTVRRADQDIVLKGNLPDPKNYYVFDLGHPTNHACRIGRAS